jgi:hypothetical protein
LGSGERAHAQVSAGVHARGVDNTGFPTRMQNDPYALLGQAGQIGEFMKPKVSIAERLAGSIQLDDQKLIDEIIESEIWDYDEDLECMADWPSDSEKSDHDEATTRGDEKHTDPSGDSLSPVDEVRQ